MDLCFIRFCKYVRMNIGIPWTACREVKLNKICHNIILMIQETKNDICTNYIPRNTHRTHHIKIKWQNGNSSRLIFLELHKIWWAEKAPTLRAYLLSTYRGNVAKIFIIHLQYNNSGKFSIIVRLKFISYQENHCK